MNNSMDAGISYGGISIGASTSDTQVDVISQDVQSSYSKNVNTNVTLTCDQGNGTEGVGLWQYNVATSDWKTTVYTLHTVCRYGENYNSPPACPWNFCDPMDPQCTQCTEEWNAAVAAAESADSEELILAAQVTEAPPAEEPHSAAYAGAAFGIVAAIAAGSLYRKCNKKINANEEPLL